MEIWNFSSRAQLDISLVRSAHWWVIKLKTPYLRAPIYLFSLYLNSRVKRTLKCVILVATYVVTTTQGLIDPHKDQQPVGLIAQLVGHFTGIAVVRLPITLKNSARITHFKLRGMSSLMLKSTPVRTFRNSSFFHCKFPVPLIIIILG